MTAANYAQLLLQVHGAYAEHMRSDAPVIKVGEQSMDVFAFAYQVSQVLAGMRNAELFEARTWGIENWSVYLDSEVHRYSDITQAQRRVMLYVETLGKRAVEHVMQLPPDEPIQAEDMSTVLGNQFARIANTEIQGMHNGVVANESLNNWGVSARIARIPETTACSRCRETYLEADGTPKMFLVAEATSSGALWPRHPNCRCDTIEIPPDMHVTLEGTLENN